MSFSDWKEVKLEDITTNFNKKRIPLSSKQRNIKQGMYPYYGAQGVIDYIDEYIFEGRYLLIAEDGANLETRNEDIARLTNDKEKFWVNNHAHILKENDKSDIRYIKYFLNKEDLSGYITGSAQPKLNKSNLNKISIFLPPLNEQKAIANILSTLDEKIETNNKINKNLESVAQEVFKHWFVDFEFPDENGKPYKSSGGVMVESEMGLIPEGWEVIELNEMVTISTESIKPQENKEIMYEHYSIPSLDKKRFPKFELGSEIKSDKYKVYEESILISKLNPSTKRIWKPVCLTKSAICSTEFINFIPISGDVKEYCYSVINSSNFTEFLINNATGSTGSRQRVKPKDTLRYKIVNPGEDEILNKYEKVTTFVYQKIDNNILENENLVNLRNTLLPKLMSGQLRVPLDK